MSTSPASMPSLETVRSARFPATADLASNILQSAPTASDAPLSETHHELLSALLCTSHGSRGLFVALLSDIDITIADVVPPNHALIQLLSTTTTSAPAPDAADSVPHDEYVRSLIVKNVVMPAAMVLRYSEMGKPDLREASLSTRDRAIRVVSAWDIVDQNRISQSSAPTVRKVARWMRDALTGVGGRFQPFIAKWGYTSYEQQAMLAALEQSLGPDF